MADASPVRRSGRERKPNRKYSIDGLSYKKYSIDAFEGLNILSSDSEAAAEVLQEGASDDGDFAFDGAAEGTGAIDEDEITEEDGSEGSGIVTPAEAYGDASSYASEIDILEHKTSHEEAPLELGSFAELPSFRPRKNLWKIEQNSHARGVPEPTRYGSNENNLKHLFGTGIKDILNIVRARDMWASPATLPFKFADKHGSRGMGYAFSHTTEKREMESTIGWNWYYEHGGREVFTKRQEIQVLHMDEVNPYMPRALNDSHSCLMGPYGKQQIHRVAVMQSMQIGEAWKDVTNAESENAEGKARKGGREGWILNLGSRVRCLDWAPNQSGRTQYLALVASPKATDPETPMNAAPSFTPSYPLPAAIQIWAFAASTDADRTVHIDENISPELVLTICTNWGAVKLLKWCPVPRVPRDDELRGKVSLGLLAGIWGDGNVRVLDVHVDRVHNSSASYVKYEGAAFAARPPNTLCTCLTWLSATDLAAGCANGFVAIWNIFEVSQPPTLGSAGGVTSPTASSPVTVPWFYQQMHQTYILAMASAYPAHPHLLATSSMDGYMRLADLRAPSTDSVFTNRSRIGSSVIDYCEPLQAMVSTEENDFIRINPLRRFFSSISVGRADGIVLSLSVGKVHPTILVGTADGAVVAMNPMRKGLNSKTHQYQQTWFQHEWSRKGDGMSRILDGFKVETVSLARSLVGDKKNKDGTVYSTIYEEETGVTQVVWNPNLHCGGWVAAGMGSGLLRVEDLAL
ncbi:MAG: transcription factor TFIIIC complex subunit Tfc6 [Lasallia pustulata]|uniref:Transcription factor TFIIIC complex subunit Tfc6 n=1 Tax=Lasallia pustulata TaxID=136370 RepID=A0A5M8Q4L2_9LECA|nr:MAG: transcription factor TFIIIC complex subunit Tfc6 [Lasallia pustulata]